MKKKGFTLIELLAVIVVLAIIALIATPIVMNTIKKSQKGAAERSADNYIEAVETEVATKRLEGNILEGEYLVQTDGNLCPTSGCGENDKDKVIIDMSGNKPTSGTIIIKDGQVTTDSKMIIGEYIVHYDSETKKYTVAKPKTYTNGEEVYFNVTTGNKCTSSDYTETQSSTGTKGGCMKFYAFNDDGGDTVNLILDHNTTALIAWSLSEINNGPKEVLEQLKADTESWKGTKTPANYTMDQTGQTSNVKYTIDYSSYKARLITANEIATITGKTLWDEKTASDYYFFDTNTTTHSDTCWSGDTSGCNYGWLYDRTYPSCMTYGCLNNSDQTTSGYWTASSRAASSNSAWFVGYYASVNRYVSNGDIYGVRPVIEVLKSKIL